jgi:betaine-aldehyde dehydrogenase
MSAGAAATVPEALLLVGGERSEGTLGARRLVFDPATGEAIGSVAQATSGRGCARPASRTMPPRLEAADTEDRAAALSSGSPRGSRGCGDEPPRGWRAATSDAVVGEILLGADCFEYYAGAATKFGGATIPVSARGASVTFREPLGVCALIVPWNFPFAIATWKIAPALAMGNTVIVKPASDTPLSALRLCELALEAGVPPGAFHVLPGPGETTGAALVAHPLVRKVSFTGSTEAGKSVMRLAADGVKRISLELGGKSACLIFEDADLSTCLPSALWSVFDNAGQDCCARSRFLVQRTIYDRVVADLARMTAAIRVGNPLAPETEMGPLITPAHREKVRGWLATGDAEGARRVTGGELPTAPELAKGNYLTPAVFADVDNEMRVAREEIFGPVVSVIPFDGEEEAVNLANASRYGLSGSLYTRDLGRAMRVARSIETGVLSVNSSRSVFLEAPFGGVKESGLGRELGLSALEHYTETKTVFFSEE